MARRRTKKKRPVSLSKIELVPATVENPYWRPDLEGENAVPRTVTAMINVRESTVSFMASRKDKNGKPLLSMSQVYAATEYRRHWENAGGRGAQAIDYSRDAVDGGKIAEPINVIQMESARNLADARAYLGRRAYLLVQNICGEGRSLQDLYCRKRDQLTQADNLRAALDDLCELWGLSVTASARPRRQWKSERRTA